MNFGGSKWNSGGNECTILKSYKKIQKSFGGIFGGSKWNFGARTVCPLRYCV